MTVSTWYESPVDVATVGGDCYEVLETAHGTRLIIGDVRGHGLPSVRLAALVLGAFRVLAHIEADLAKIARELDALVRAVCLRQGKPRRRRRGVRHGGASWSPRLQLSASSTLATRLLC